MIRIENRFQLKQVRAECQAETKQEKCRVLICGGTGCLAGGSAKLYEHMKELAAEHENVQVEIGPEIAHIGVHKSGCHGFCEMGPLMRIEPYGYLYLKVQESDCGEIFEKTVLRGQPVERLMFRQDNKVYPSEEEIPFYAKQTRLVLKNCGHIDAERIEAAIAAGAYEGLEKALFEMTPKAVIQAITDSKLRGRGGGGLPRRQKMEPGGCPEGNRPLCGLQRRRGRPRRVYGPQHHGGRSPSDARGHADRGLSPQARTEGYIYVRAEYPLAVERLRMAIAQAGGSRTSWATTFWVRTSASICISTAAPAPSSAARAAHLTASIEGKRGMPRVKPPRTVEHGLWEKPTVLNNVETYANVPMIIQRGAEWYRGIGTPESPGTKAFALTGNVCNTGLIEVPMGTPLRDIVFDVGGGIPNGKKFKAVQIGGPSGGCLSEKDLDRHMDFDSLTKIGAMIGSGGMVVMDEDTCMVEVARFFMSFTQRESCGKCVPCREGTQADAGDPGAHCGRSGHHGGSGYPPRIWRI